MLISSPSSFHIFHYSFLIEFLALKSEPDMESSDENGQESAGFHQRALFIHSYD